MSRHPSHKRSPLRVGRKRGKKRVIIPGRIRRIVPGTVWLVTKKCTDDLFLIRPDPLVNQILLYTLILWANKRGVVIHGFCFMSNHFHLVVTDVEGRLPAFMRDFLSDSSKALQVATGVDRPIWNRKRYSAVECLDLDAAERTIAYTILNPLRAGLTEPRDWPGATSANYDVGETITVERPRVYFSRRRPELVSAQLAPVAPSFAGANISTSLARLEWRIADGAIGAHEALRRRGRRLAGRDKVLRTSRQRRSRRRVRTAIPRFATRDRELMRWAKAEEGAFQEGHASALRRYLDGSVHTLFPLGTYGYRELLPIRVSTGGPAA